MNSQADDHLSFDVFNHNLVETFSAEPWRDVSDHLPTARLRLMTGRDQDALEASNVAFIGAGAASITAFAMARSGMRKATIFDPDFAEITNTCRQFIYPGDLGQPKAHRVAANIAAEAVNGGDFTGVALPFPMGLDYLPQPQKFDLVICLVDDQQCRIDAARWTRTEGIPAVIAGFGTDANCGYVFLQGARREDACLACAYPAIKPGKAPCGPAAMKTAFLVGSMMLHFADIALGGQPPWAEPVNERLLDFWGRVEYARFVERREECWLCGVES
jgi:hypothetical protein